MYSIDQALKESDPWEKCAISLGNALFLLDKHSQIHIADRARFLNAKLLNSMEGNRRPNDSIVGFMYKNSDISKEENNRDDTPPDLVQLEIAQDALRDAKTARSPEKVTLLATASICAFVFSAQIHAWMTRETRDYETWKRMPSRARGVYECRDARDIGIEMWTDISERVKRAVMLAGVNERNVFQVTAVNPLIVAWVEGREPGKQAD